ncbi:hypothetical protein G7Y89_g8880 [Cudoniella acicularis]|uniref:Pal1-domain-containing protein n=1 Tax=Cudoniella acicularis TaxID=354080 RepID=A0A8H4RHC9_9HELO|nr:hypothetical protein G7Y89_g8880 [Cudoniella acicularis]
MGTSGFPSPPSYRFKLKLRVISSGAHFSIMNLNPEDFVTPGLEGGSRLVPLGRYEVLWHWRWHWHSPSHPRRPPAPDPDKANLNRAQASLPSSSPRPPLTTPQGLQNISEPIARPTRWPSFGTSFDFTKVYRRNNYPPRPITSTAGINPRSVTLQSCRSPNQSQQILVLPLDRTLTSPPTTPFAIELRRLPLYQVLLAHLSTLLLDPYLEIHFSILLLQILHKTQLVTTQDVFLCRSRAQTSVDWKRSRIIHAVGCRELPNDNLTLNDRPSTSNNTMRPPPRSSTGEKMPPPYTAVASGRGENVPPRGPPGHRPSRSQEEALRARKPGGPSRTRPSGDLDIFADPPEGSSSRKSESRRVRRNSDSSVLSRNGKLLDTEEEKKRAERKRRERRHRERESKDPKSRKPDRKLDIIDKLDVTSIYGTGLFHHDGPFDACNPHRNRQGSRRAPMQAFPKDSLNNVLGGGGPLNKRPDHATFLGNNDEEAFKDYSGQPYENGMRPRPQRLDSNVVSATTRVEPIHGEETPGLGTSTFLEGAPASRTAIQRREIDAPAEGGLGRKKSLAQRIKSINNNNRRDFGPSGRVTSSEGVLSNRSPETPAFAPSGNKIHESNPFFNEFTKGDDSKKEGITFVEPEKTGRPRAPSSPRRGFTGLERRVTSDGTSGETGKTGGGFLSRVKSLKGGPRKPARPDKPLPTTAEP